MSTAVPFATRLSLAWRVLTDPDSAARLRHQDQHLSGTAETTLQEPQPAPTLLVEARPDGALQLLGLLQQEGRLVDFLQQDVTGFNDTDVANAARVVHQGCRKVLEQYFRLVPVSDGNEGERLTLVEGFDPARFRVTGNVVGQPPFSGTLVHRGWRADEVKLPKLAPEHDVAVIAPAEVEL